MIDRGSDVELHNPEGGRADALPIRIAKIADHIQIAKQARRPMKRPSVKALAHRTNFYWTPYQTRHALANAAAAIGAGDIEAALRWVETDDPHNIELHLAALIIAQSSVTGANTADARARADASVSQMHIAGRECLDRGNPAIALSLLLRAACGLPFLIRPGSKAPGVVLCDLATALQDLNQFALASRIYSEALEACPSGERKHWLQRSVILSNFGVMRMIEGHFDEASRILFESIDFTKRSGEAPPTELIAVLVNAGHSERTRGNIGSSRKLLREATAVARKSGQTATTNYARALIHLSDLDLEAGRISAAIRRCRLVQRLAGAFSKRLEGQAHAMEGECQAKIRRYEAARQSFQRAYDLLEGRPNDDADERVEIRQLLADVERRLGSLDRAEILLEEARTIGDAHYGKQWIGHADTLKVRGRIAWDRESFEECLVIRTQAVRQLAGTVADDHPKRLLLDGELAEAMAATGKSGRALRLLKSCMRREGKLLSRLVDRKNSFLELGHLRVTRQHLEVFILILLRMRRRSKWAIGTLIEAILALRGLAASIWRAKPIDGVAAEPLRKAREPDAQDDHALVIAETYTLEGQRSRLLLARSWNALTLTELGEAETLENAFRDWIEKDGAASLTLTDFSDDLIRVAEGAEKLVWMPDHALAMHPICALPLSNGKLIADSATIIQPRDAYALAGPARAARSPGPSLVVGVSRFPPSMALRNLPGVATETVLVAQMLHGEGPTVLAEDEATVPAVVAALSRVPKRIHIATHGLVATAAPDKDLVRVQIAAAARRDPLAGTALVLGGTNSPGEMGLLSARDVLRLDLRGVKLVVIAACDSGVASSDASEGILGLQAAFHASGAETVITTLWPLYDLPTTYLVEQLYAEVLLGKPPAECLRRAQAATRRKWAGKSYWGGWIVSGPASG